MAPASSKRIARELVVPWSSANTYAMLALPLPATSQHARLGRGKARPIPSTLSCKILTRGAQSVPRFLWRPAFALRMTGSTQTFAFLRTLTFSAKSLFASFPLSDLSISIKLPIEAISSSVNLPPLAFCCEMFDGRTFWVNWEPYRIRLIDLCEDVPHQRFLLCHFGRIAELEKAGFKFLVYRALWR